MTKKINNVITTEILCKTYYHVLCKFSEILRKYTCYRTSHMDSTVHTAHYGVMQLLHNSLNDDLYPSLDLIKELCIRVT